MSDSSLALTRIVSLLDESSFVEIGAGITDRATDFNQKPKEEKSDGVITGYGLIEGSPVYVFSQNPAVLGGSVGEMHARKIAALYKLAMKTGAPVIGLLDSTGMRLAEGTDALMALGKLAKTMTKASGIIPQIMGVFGEIGGGLAVLTGLADFVFQEEKARLFVNAPDAIKGNSKEKCDNGAVKFQTEETPNVDFAGSAEEVYAGIRSLVAMLPSNNEDDGKLFEGEDDPNRLIPEIAGAMTDPAVMFAQIADDAEFFELKAGYAKHMVTGFMKLNGQLVGVFGNRSEVYDENGEKSESFEEKLYPKGVTKAVELIRFCDAFEIPILSVANLNGFRGCLCGEKSHIEKTSALIAAYAAASVPKVSLVTGKAISAAALAMGTKSTGADLALAWEGAKIGPMEPEMAAKVLFDGKSAKELEEAALQYEAGVVNADNAARRGFIDLLIRPEETRKQLAYAFEMLYSKVEHPDKKHGTK